MEVPYVLLCALFGIIIRNTSAENIFINNELSLQSTESGIGWDVIVHKDKVSKTIGTIGRSFKNEDLSIIKQKSGVKIEIPNVSVTVTVEKSEYGDIYKIDWITYSTSLAFEDCYSLEGTEWFGGPQQKQQYWPIQKLTLKDYSYVSKEADNAAIIEPYWLSSGGWFFYVEKHTPLFIDQNNRVNNSVCFIGKVAPPYSSHRQANKLTYWLGSYNDVKVTHKQVVGRFLGKPKGIPDFRMVQHPIWSTWAEYKREINESIVLEFANKILDYGFNNSQLEIDDLWEVCYGSLTVDTKSFPDLKNLTLKLKEMGFRVTIWIHPFINKGCEPWYSEAMNKGYLVKNEQGDVDTSWWNNNGTVAAYVDFTNPEAEKWWVDRVEILRKKYEIDSFKFDAGESSWSPQIPVQLGPIEEHPAHITQKYVRACAQFGPIVEVRAGQRTQDLPIFVRMIDKDSEWNFENGLPTLVTTLLQMNMNGYPFVLPDMIGGNGYNGSPSKELFIRWLEANVFMPSLQYSYVPWDYDNETIEISRKFTDIHARYAPEIYEAMKRAAMIGDPVNPPVWWSDPSDQEALKIWDQYMLGDDILVAPILNQGQNERDVYLIKGKWMAFGDENDIHEGPKWLRNFKAPLDTLPYFIRVL